MCSIILERCSTVLSIVLHEAITHLIDFRHVSRGRTMNPIIMVACNGSDDLRLGGQRELGEPHICGVSGLIIEVVS